MRSGTRRACWRLSLGWGNYYLKPLVLDSAFVSATMYDMPFPKTSNKVLNPCASEITKNTRTSLSTTHPEVLAGLRASKETTGERYSSSSRERRNKS